ncbi:ParA family protein, partial [Pseudomonas aeruginosa]
MDNHETARPGRLSSSEGRAMIFAFLNQKGGVGKTTLATHIAGELAMRG